MVYMPNHLHHKYIKNLQNHNFSSFSSFEFYPWLHSFLPIIRILLNLLLFQTIFYFITNINPLMLMIYFLPFITFFSLKIIMMTFKNHFKSPPQQQYLDLLTFIKSTLSPYFLYFLCFLILNVLQLIMVLICYSLKSI